MRRATVVLLVSAAAGCSALSDEVGTSEQDTTIHPEDDESLGYVQADVPVTAPVDSVTKTATSFRGSDGVQQNLVVGQPLRVKKGDGRVSVNGGLVGGSTAVTVAPAATTKVMLAGTDLDFDRSKLAVTFGRQVAAKISRKNDLGQTETGVISGSGTFMLLPGEYTVDYYTQGQGSLSGKMPLLSPTTKTFPAGAVTSLDLAPPDVRSLIKVKIPVREYPDAVPGNGATTYPNCHRKPFAIVQRADKTTTSWAAGQVHASNALFVGTEVNFSVFPFAAEEAPEHYEIVVNNMPVVLTTQPGVTTEVQLGRIDIDHVKITTETGEVRVVPGTYRLYRQVASAWVPVEIADRGSGCEPYSSAQYVTYMTRTGIDVVAGTYKAVVYYATAESPANVQEFIVNVP